MTKQEAQDEWDAIVTAPAPEARRRRADPRRAAWFAYTPVGPAGVQLRRLDRRARRLRVGLAAVRIARVPRLADAGRGDGPPSFAARPAPPAGGDRSRSAAAREHAAVRRPDLRPRSRPIVIAAAAPFDELLAAVARRAPTHLVGYASVVGPARPRGARRAASRSAPVRVSTNSEPLSDEDRDAIHDAWGAPLHNLVGFDRDRSAGRRVRSRRRPARLRGRGDPRARRRVGRARRSRRAGRPHARDRAREPHLPVHPLRPRRPGDACSSESCPCGSCAGPRRRHRRPPRRRLPLRRAARSPRARSATCSAPTRRSPSTRSGRPAAAPTCSSSASRTRGDAGRRVARIARALWAERLDRRRDPRRSTRAARRNRQAEALRSAVSAGQPASYAVALFIIARPCGEGAFC